MLVYVNTQIYVQLDLLIEDVYKFPSVENLIVKFERGFIII